MRLRIYNPIGLLIAVILVAACSDTGFLGTKGRTGSTGVDKEEVGNKGDDPVKPSDEGEGIPGFLTDPDLIAILEDEDSCYGISGASQSIGTEDGNDVTKVSVDFFQLTTLDIVTEADKLYVTGAKILRSVTPEKDGSFQSGASFCIDEGLLAVIPSSEQEGDAVLIATPEEGIGGAYIDPESDTKFSAFATPGGGDGQKEPGEDGDGTQQNGITVPTPGPDAGLYAYTTFAQTGEANGVRIHFALSDTVLTNGDIVVVKRIDGQGAESPFLEIPITNLGTPQFGGWYSETDNTVLTPGADYEYALQVLANNSAVPVYSATAATTYSMPCRGTVQGGLCFIYAEVNVSCTTTCSAPAQVSAGSRFLSAGQCQQTVISFGNTGVGLAAEDRSKQAGCSFIEPNAGDSGGYKYEYNSNPETVNHTFSEAKRRILCTCDYTE